ncbi:hypothetical protein JCM19301_3114 [Jejuia pallidilutea]|uniref:Uncharacterized protein n=1 Tax=Jejuia pallidilutea TaxID=504487 RepID=A0A090VPJ8_9FLAO|nr:hypothetical protein JCM19301_3114 [Jejuia pallidilutea]GAL69896.1 hypothetical protein JCM19302_791 [Jejuia pallidilutea]
MKMEVLFLWIISVPIAKVIAVLLIKSILNHILLKHIK